MRRPCLALYGRKPQLGHCSHAVMWVTKWTCCSVAESCHSPNERYDNMSIALSRTPMNVHFKDSGGLTYSAWLDKQVEDGVVALRGLKKDAKVFDKMIFDMNSSYFSVHQIRRLCRISERWEKRLKTPVFPRSRKYGMIGKIGGVLIKTEQGSIKMAYPDESVVQTWLDSLRGLNVRVKKMFGCYCVYCDNQPVGWLSESVFSLREVGLSCFPRDLKRPTREDRIQEIVIPLDYCHAEWLPNAVQETANVIKVRKK